MLFVLSIVGPRHIELGKEFVFLEMDSWPDDSFTTLFHATLHQTNGETQTLGPIRIGFRGQTSGVPTANTLPPDFLYLDDSYFSLGASDDFYRNVAQLPGSLQTEILTALRDIVSIPEIIPFITDEPVFSKALLKGTSLSAVKGQYIRILRNLPALTDFRFKFLRRASDSSGPVRLNFDVKVDALPSTNIHAIIGRNGAGKTTILNGMIQAITERGKGDNTFVLDVPDPIIYDDEMPMPDDYFSSLVSVSFSAFDPFTPPYEQSDPAKGTCYFYIGLKDPKSPNRQRSISHLRRDCEFALMHCFEDPKKTARWLNAIEKLSSDENFSAMELSSLLDTYKHVIGRLRTPAEVHRAKSQAIYGNAIGHIFKAMSSGHAIVLLTITRLVATVEEKTLVLLDEPESHLHPPLLSAFLRSLADLLHDRNGMAIIATHSPVVLQEIPKKCVWKINRIGQTTSVIRPTIETFGENVGVLTAEVFSLEVERSGFHALLAKSAESGRSYEEILADYDGRLGFEGRAILASLVEHRDRGTEQ